MYNLSVDIPAFSAINNKIIGTYPNGLTAGQIPLNGSIVGPSGIVNFGNYASSVTFAGGDLTGLIFTVVGTCNGYPVTEILPGAVAYSFTDNLFHTVTAIFVNTNTLINVNIGANVNQTVIFNSLQPKVSKFKSNYEYNLILNSLTAAGDWVAEGLMIYGVSDNAPKILNINQLGFLGQNNRSDKYFALNNTAAPTTQVSLNSGFITSTTYPFSAIIVFLNNNVNTTPTFVEITQS